MHQLNLAVKDVSFRKVSVSDIISRRLGIFLWFWCSLQNVWLILAYLLILQMWIML